MGSKYFKDNEIMCHCGCGGVVADAYFLSLLDKLRLRFGNPLMVNSFYRCKKHDDDIRGEGNHPTGKAVDIVCATSRDRGKLVGIWAQIVAEENDKWQEQGNYPAMQVPFRVGIAKTFIHIDILPELPNGELKLHPAIWLYN